jgi:hypothetical protein
MEQHNRQDRDRAQAVDVGAVFHRRSPVFRAGAALEGCGMAEQAFMVVYGNINTTKKSVNPVPDGPLVPVRCKAGFSMQKRLAALP